MSAYGVSMNKVERKYLLLPDSPMLVNILMISSLENPNRTSRIVSKLTVLVKKYGNTRILITKINTTPSIIFLELLLFIILSIIYNFIEF